MWSKIWYPRQVTWSFCERKPCIWVYSSFLILNFEGDDTCCIIWIWHFEWALLEINFWHGCHDPTYNPTLSLLINCPNNINMSWIFFVTTPIWLVPLLSISYKFCYWHLLCHPHGIQRSKCSQYSCFPILEIFKRFICQCQFSMYIIFTHF